ncbi:MAG: START domain-containing protein [Myxococcota bacterium]
MTAMSPAAEGTSPSAAPEAMPAAPPLEDIEPDALRARALEHLRRSAAWPTARRVGGVALATGYLPGLPTRAYRSALAMNRPAPDVVTRLADDTFAELAHWSREFMEGAVLETLVAPTADGAVWRLRARYRTPWPLSHREYVYRFSRERLDARRTLIIYRSVASELTVPPGFVRAVLYPSAHLITADGNGCTVEHVLATDLSGRFFPWIQRHLLTGAMLDAHARDALAQRRRWSRPKAIDGGDDEVDSP